MKVQFYKCRLICSIRDTFLRTHSKCHVTATLSTTTSATFTQQPKLGAHKENWWRDKLMGRHYFLSRPHENRSARDDYSFSVGGEMRRTNVCGSSWWMQANRENGHNTRNEPPTNNNFSYSRCVLTMWLPSLTSFIEAFAVGGDEAGHRTNEERQ